MLLKQTQSLCPICLKLLDADYILENNEVFLIKTCLEHGEFKTKIWQNNLTTPNFLDWYKNKKTHYVTKTQTQSIQGCPYDCGLCSEHKNQTCCALIEVTKNCNMLCPVCFASAKNKTTDIELTEIYKQIDFLYSQAGACNLQISGGEPTTREDLPEIISYARSKNFALIQLNTNGLVLAENKNYAQNLKNAGLDLVYLQFDGTNDEIYKQLRAGTHLKAKQNAIQNCLEAKLAVVLVVTVAKNINENNLGEIVNYALSLPNLVRGVHFQPLALFGRYPKTLEKITLADTMHQLVQQNTLLNIRDFNSPRAEHSLCSFNALYQRKNKGLEYISSNSGCCENALESTKNFVAKHWQEPTKNSNLQDDFDKFLHKADLENRFTISGMAFQDAYSFDIERVRNCHIHILSPDFKLIPFCAYNLTNQAGLSLYRK